MIKLTIDKTEIEVSEGSTILDAANKLGIDIPSMCYLAGYTKFTSCMVCMVKNVSTGKLIPSCSALAENGMIIDTTSEEVSASRKTALELLLSDHVGDCEAPCQRVCPAGINIPVMIRHIRDGDIDTAATVICQSTGSTTNPCDSCAKPCENACRRRQHDSAVSILLLVKFALENGQTDTPNQNKHAKIFNCNMGRLLDGELEVFLQNASPLTRTEPSAGFKSGYSLKEAQQEAARCLHCDCRKQTTCKLRDYSHSYKAQQRKYAGEARHRFTQIQQHTGIIYEPEKCIKCGICIRITEKDAEPLGLTFIGRGFDVQVGAPLHKSLANALTTTAKACVRACPTGALALIS